MPAHRPLPPYAAGAVPPYYGGEEEPAGEAGKVLKRYGGVVDYLAHDVGAVLQPLDGGRPHPEGQYAHHHGAAGIEYVQEHAVAPVGLFQMFGHTATPPRFQYKGSGRRPAAESPLLPALLSGGRTGRTPSSGAAPPRRGVRRVARKPRSAIRGAGAPVLVVGGGRPSRGRARRTGPGAGFDMRDR